MPKTKPDPSRLIETTLEIDAPVESVWKAISEARELERWFPLHARVSPGEGGEVFMSWGPPWEGGARIEVWEENRRLRTRGFLEHGDASMVEYTLEARGGRTRLRLVHSGFAAGGDWEDELFDGTERGWRYELRSLRHYLERHAGRDRVVVWPRARVLGTAAEVWSRLLGAQGLVREGRIEGLAEGDAYRVVAVTDESFEGTVVVNHPPFEFAGTVAGMNDALLSLRTHEAAGPEPKGGHVACLFFSAWGVPRADVEALGERWQRVLDQASASEA
jgi:uncharacterized protein YndB with AHSA1/START domain